MDDGLAFRIERLSLDQEHGLRFGRDGAVSVAADPLERRARELWPDSEHNRREWLRSVRMLRAGRGWVLDGAPVSWRAHH